MKKILITLLFSSLTALAANKEVEPGYYEAIDTDKGENLVQMQINADGTAEVSLITKSVFKPDINCTGTWSVTENIFVGELECDSFFVPFIDVNIDITNVTPETVRLADGVPVTVQLDIVGPEPKTFMLKKIEEVPQ